MSLSRLRGAISIIPQQPFLFQDSIRKNLQPFGTDQSDCELWDALEEVTLKELIESLPSQLDTICDNKEVYFSAG